MLDITLPPPLAGGAVPFKPLVVCWPRRASQPRAVQVPRSRRAQHRRRRLAYRRPRPRRCPAARSNLPLPDNGRSAGRRDAGCPAPHRTTDIVSFDGTKIRAHWFPLSKFPPGGTAPTVLKGPGWGQSGDTNTTSTNYGLFGDLSIRRVARRRLQRADMGSRAGFGKSGGTVETDSADFEGRDGRATDLGGSRSNPVWSSRRPATRALGWWAPRTGGGIQLITRRDRLPRRRDRSPDCVELARYQPLHRADRETRLGRSALQQCRGSSARPPHHQPRTPKVTQRASLSAADQQWFLDRGPGNLVNKIKNTRRCSNRERSIRCSPSKRQ